MATDDHAPRLFISHSPQDDSFALWVGSALRQLGHNVWLRQNTLGGSPTIDAIHQALDESDIMLLVVTPNALKSALINREWTYFYCECDKRLIPLLVEPPDKINFMLASLQYMDFYKQDRETALSSLHVALQDVYTELNQRSQLTDDVVPANFGYGTREPGESDGKLSASQAGLIHVHLRLPIDVYLKWLRVAQDRIWLLNTWTAVVDYDRLFIEAIARGVAVEILLLDPSSPFARQRSLDLHLGNSHEPPDEEQVPNNIRAAIRRMAHAYPSVQHLPGKLDLRLYNLLPSFPIYGCDHKAYVGFFPHSAKMTDFAVLEIQMNTPLGEQVDAEFKRIQQHATPVDLSPHQPPT